MPFDPQSFSPAQEGAPSPSSANETDPKKLIGNFAPVARIMKTALPDNAKIAKEAKECMQECVSEFISFITSEGVFCSLLLQDHRAISLQWLLKPYCY